MSDSKHDPNPLSLSHHGIPPWPARDGGERERVFSPPPVARVGGGPAQSCEPPLRRDGTGEPATHALARGRGEVRDGAGRTAMLHILNPNVTDNWGEPFVPVGPNQRVRAMSSGKISDPGIGNRSDGEQADLEYPLAADWEVSLSHTPGRFLSNKGQQVSDYGLPSLGQYQDKKPNELDPSQGVPRSTSRDPTLGEANKNGVFDSNQQGGTMPTANPDQLVRALLAAVASNNAGAQTHFQGHEVGMPLGQGRVIKYPVQGDGQQRRVVPHALPRDLDGASSVVDENAFRGVEGRGPRGDFVERYDSSQDIPSRECYRDDTRMAQSGPTRVPYANYQQQAVSFDEGLITKYDHRDSFPHSRGNYGVRSRGDPRGGPGDDSPDDSSPRGGGRGDPRNDPSRRGGVRGVHSIVVVESHRGGPVVVALGATRTMMTLSTLPEGGVGGTEGMIPTVVAMVTDAMTARTEIVIGVIAVPVTAFHLEWGNTSLILMHSTPSLITIFTTIVDQQPCQSDTSPLLISVKLKM